MDNGAKVYAISDLHIGHAANRRLLEQLPYKLSDWLIIAGDVGEDVKHLETTLDILVPKFEQLIWVPGNHDLWTYPNHQPRLRGQAKYESLVECCRRYGVLTPEDSYAEWVRDSERYVLVPMFLLYDYTYRPAHVPKEKAIEWAMEEGILCADEAYLWSDPYPSKEAWCQYRCSYTERRLASISRLYKLVLINHYPLRSELIRLPLLPRLSIWCGTKRSEDWHKRFNVSKVIYGHLHRRSIDRIDHVEFQEVSLGYPHQHTVSDGRVLPLRRVI